MRCHPPPHCTVKGVCLPKLDITHVLYVILLHVDYLNCIYNSRVFRINYSIYEITYIYYYTIYLVLRINLPSHIYSTLNYTRMNNIIVVFLFVKTYNNDFFPVC